MFARIQKSIAFRVKMARFGIFCGRSKSFSIESLRIAGKRVRPVFPNAERGIHEYELGKILFEECYGLKQIPGAKTILDVGANVGLFSMAARHFFRDSIVHAYEPNEALEPFLKSNCDQTSVSYYLSGLGIAAGAATLRRQEYSLHSILQPDP